MSVRHGSIISRYEENNSRQDCVRKRINRGQTRRVTYEPSRATGSVGAIGDLIRLYFVLIHKYIWRERERRYH